jgi:peptidoglycan/LPS O-acetylase OafA/YrhL
MQQIIPRGLPGVGKTINFFLCYFIAVLASCAVSYFTYNYIEIPGMKMGRLLIRRLADQ